MSLALWAGKKALGKSIGIAFKLALAVFAIGALKNMFNNEADDDGFVKNAFENGFETVGDVAEFVSNTLDSDQEPS